jgi:hypothetical protein
MKQWMAAAAGIALLAGVTAANAQNPPASTNDKSDRTTQMNGAPSEQKGASQKSMSSHKQASSQHKTRHHVAMRHHYRGSTTGAGGRVGAIGGPKNDPSIHQSIQRDSRGTPKGPGADINK